MYVYYQDGVLDWNEINQVTFRNFIIVTNLAIKQAKAPKILDYFSMKFLTDNSKSRSEKAKLYTKKLYQLFNRYDTDKNGVLDKKESIELLGDMYDLIHQSPNAKTTVAGKPANRMTWINALYKALDKDKNGKLDWNELTVNKKRRIDSKVDLNEFFLLFSFLF